MDISANDYTAAQLRGWLQHLGLQSNGTKSDLLIRLNDVPFDERGDCPTNILENKGELKDDKVGAKELNDETNENETEASEMNESLTNDCQQENKDEENDSNKGEENDNNKGEENDGNKREIVMEEFFKQLDLNEQRKEANELILLKRELEITRREKELLRKENEILKEVAKIEKNYQEKELIQNKKKNPAKPNECDPNAAHNQMNASFSMLKDMIPHYDGGLFPELWVAQFQSICKVYAANEDTTKALLMCKLKEKAQLWLHSKPNFVFQSTNEILNDLTEAFCTKESKIILRRKFEARKWKFGETFTQYFNEKVALANKVGVDDDELVENLIEGIPDRQLKVQSNLQCFSNKSQLLQSFSKIQLTGLQQKQTSEMRKDNCNCLGHMAAECRKPTRPVGSCYGCGSMDHRVSACPERKTSIQLVDDGDYNA